MVNLERCSRGHRPKGAKAQGQEEATEAAQATPQEGRPPFIPKDAKSKGKTWSDLPNVHELASNLLGIR